MRYKSLTQKHTSVNLDPDSTAARLLRQMGYVEAPELTDEAEEFYRPEDEIPIAHDEPVTTDNPAGVVAPAQPELGSDDNPFALPDALNQPAISADDPAVANAPTTDDTDDSTGTVKGRASSGGKGLKTVRGT